MSIHNDIDVTIRSGTVGSGTSIWHGCVSPELAQIIYGEVQARYRDGYFLQRHSQHPSVASGLLRLQR
ncbi:hypothetical protein [Streptomyces sp. NPDC005012]|uniref:hypothetical protein n=1 Tax=Streptomyces sp. NPDC005012 TaxID=3154558 RepID=UPI0033B111AE